MSRGIRIWRPLVVWLAVTGTLLGAATSTPGAWAAAREGSSPTAAADLLVAVCATALVAALAWLWAVTTLTVVELLSGGTGRTRGASVGATRRLVLLACGAAVVAGTSVPAVAADRGTAELLSGLPLPDRAVAPAEPARSVPAPAATTVRAASAVADHHVVRPGDSLWSIARAHPAPGTDTDERWREIWQANREVVGDDPDLILPGQALRLPAPDDNHDTHDEQDGAR